MRNDKVIALEEKSWIIVVLTKFIFVKMKMELRTKIKKKYKNIWCYTSYPNLNVLH